MAIASYDRENVSTQAVKVYLQMCDASLGRQRIQGHPKGLRVGIAVERFTA